MKNQLDNRAFEYINFYRENSFNLVPFKLEGGAHFEWKPYQTKKSSDAEMGAWMAQTESFAIVTGGTSNAVAIDVDAEDLFEDMHLGQLAAQTYTEKRGNRYHIFLRTKAPIASESLKFNGKEDIGILSEGHIVYCGGMPHPKGGEPYKHLVWSPKSIKVAGPDLIEHLKRVWREHRGIVTKTEKGLSRPPKGIEITSPLLDIIKDCVALEEVKETAEGIVCRCPFPGHSDTEPSFFVNAEKNVFYCHGCVKGGGAIEFISAFYKIGKKAAIKQLKGKGVLTEVEKESEEVFNHDNFFEQDGRLYMEVGTPEDNLYRFAYMQDGVVKLTDTVGDIKPVEIPRKKNGKVTAMMEIPSEDIVTAELLEPHALFNAVITHIAQYCDLSQDHLELSTYYALFTWFHRKGHHVGYLRFLADFGKGKSRMLDVIGDLCMYPLRAGGAGSFSGMMRQYEDWHGTLLLDEADMSGDTMDQRIKYHNEGISDRGSFPLSNKQNPSGPAEIFTPFGPRIFGAREVFLDNALESRLISISTHATTNGDIPILLQTKYLEDTAILRDKIARFVLVYWNEIDGELLADFRGLGMSGRLQSIIMPISIIGQIWKEANDKLKEFGKLRQDEVVREASQSWVGSLFNTILELARGTTQPPLEFRDFKDVDGNLQAITPGMLKSLTGGSGKGASKTLRSIDFEVEQKRIDVATFDAEGHTTTVQRGVRAYAIPSGTVWRENIDRYYFSKDKDYEEQKNIPQILKSKTFVDGVASADFKAYDRHDTNVTNNGAETHGHKTFFSVRGAEAQKGLENIGTETEETAIVETQKLAHDEEYQRKQSLDARKRLDAQEEVRE